MKTKGLLSTLALVVFAGSLAAGATGAFFSDSESSTGNVFTAGELDLLVDSSAHYNEVICVDTDAGLRWVPEDLTEWNEESARHEVINNGSLEDDIDDFTAANPAHYPVAGTQCGGSWSLSDLGPTFKFFDYADLKPGDEGENTISIHVDTNDSYVCAVIDNMEDNDLGITEPEAEAGDVTMGNGNGELSPEVHFFAWLDDGDNDWEDGEAPLFSNTEGPASDVLDGEVYPLYTPDTLGFLPGNQTAYVGLYWCYGALDVDLDANSLTCDGSAVTNLSQSDQLKADITFYAEQARHNGDFQCPDLIDDEEEEEVTPPTVTEGLANMVSKFGTRFRSFNNTGGEEVYLGKHDLGAGPNRVAQNLSWSKPGQHSVTFVYSTTTDSLAVRVAGNATTTYPNLAANASCAPGDFDTMNILVREQANTTVDFNSVVLNGFALGSFGGTTAGSNWTVGNFDFGDGFTMTGSVDLTGTFTNSQEAAKVEVMVGCGN